MPVTYLDAAGGNTTLWPDNTFRFRHRLRRFDPRAYVLRTSNVGAKLRTAMSRDRRTGAEL